MDGPRWASLDDFRLVTNRTESNGLSLQPSPGDAPSVPAEGCGVSDPASPRLAVGQCLELRKPHACGGHRWNVTRVGADVGLECETCRRRIMLARDEFNRRLRRIVSEPSS